MSVFEPLPIEHLMMGSPLEGVLPIEDNSNSSSSWLEKGLEFFENNKTALTVGAFSLGLGYLGFQLLKEKIKNELVSDENVVLHFKVFNLERKLEEVNSKLTTLETKLESAGQLCVICQEQALTSIFVPCGHSVCDNCALKVKQCPFCCRIIERVIKRY